jgi:hypothetical protein
MKGVDMQQKATKETKRKEGGAENPDSDSPSFPSLPSVSSWFFNPGLLAPTSIANSHRLPGGTLAKKIQRVWS